jgi:hypothetical protein
MREQGLTLVENALDIAKRTGSDRIFLFLTTSKEYRWFKRSGFAERGRFVLVLPRSVCGNDEDRSRCAADVIHSWSGNQSRFSRIKYAFLRAVMEGLIEPDSKVVCVLGPWGKTHLDTVTIHDLAHSWSEEFPFDPRSLVVGKAFHTVMAVVDIALDIGAVGREGRPVGTTFIIGDAEHVMNASHQAVFNPFKGYPKKERLISRPEVVESIKELAKLDGAFVVSDKGTVEAAGRHLDARGVLTKQLRGLGSRHRAAAGMTRMTDAVAVVVSESTGRVTVFEKGHIVSTLEPVISQRLA